MQDEPRASYSRGVVPYSLAPDWVATRVRACGGLAFGDAYPDLFCGNGGSSFHPSQVFYGQDGLLPLTPGWQSAAPAWLTDAAPADFDLDGDIDVATSNQGNTSDPYRPTYLFRNLGAGLEASPSWASSQVGITSACDWGDMDGDGHPELAVSGWVNWQSGVFRNLGTTLETGFAWTTGHPERTDKGIGWADVDGDQQPDLCVGGNGAPDWLFHNEGAMLGALPVWSSGEAYNGCQELAWEDVDGDGDPDLCSAHFSTGHVRIYLNQGEVLPAPPAPALSGGASAGSSTAPRGVSRWVWSPGDGEDPGAGVFLVRATGVDGGGARRSAAARVVRLRG
jgi:hypothetical protein